MKMAMTSLLAAGGLFLAVGCGGTAVEDISGEGAAHTPMVDEAPAADWDRPVTTLAACRTDYVQAIKDARNAIAANCGGISSCGSGDSSVHNDIFLTSNSRYCSCYDYMWSQRNNYPFNQLQVIYHNPSSCGSPHIHLESKSLCGKVHFAVDNSDNDCYLDSASSQWDRYLNSSCGVASDSRKVTCVNP